MKKYHNFLKKKNIIFTPKRYFIDALSYMALGLFGTLIVGSILKVIGTQLHISFLTKTVAPSAMSMMGPGIAVAVAYGLEAPPLVIFSSVVTGSAGAAAGGPVGALIAAVFGAEFGKLISKETKVDIIITPMVTMIIGVLAGILVGPHISRFMENFGALVNHAVTLQPIPMGIIVSVLMGMALTLPISSAAIGIMLSLSGLAAGASAAGCSAQMIVFAVISFKVNGINGLLSQGIGTSMLQIPNIVKNWKIWIPAITASAITGPLSTTVFKMQNTAFGSGMGTSGLVGQFGAFEAMTAGGISPSKAIFAIILIHFVLPAIIGYTVYLVLKKAKFIAPSDLKLTL